MPRNPVLEAVLAVVAAAALLGRPTDARAADVVLDGLKLVQDYRDFVERYRKADPASTPEGREIVRQAAGWNLDMARIAATLAAMPPPKADTVVRLDEDDRGGPSRSGSAAGGGRGGRMRTADTSLNNPYSNDDAFERTRAESGVKLTDRERSGDDMAGAGDVRVSATLWSSSSPTAGTA